MNIAPRKRGRPPTNKGELTHDGTGNVTKGVCTVRTCSYSDDCEILRITHKLPKEVCSYFKKTGK